MQTPRRSVADRHRSRHANSRRSVASAAYRHPAPFGDAKRAVAELLARIERMPLDHADRDTVEVAAAVCALCSAMLGDVARVADAGQHGDSSTARASMELEGEVWALSFAGRTARVRDYKGVRDVAQLVRHAHRDVACLDLVGAQMTDTGADRMIDLHGLRALRQRIRDVDALIDEAIASGDATVASVAQRERDRIMSELRAVTSVDGRPRPTPSAASRARNAVRYRIRQAISRIEAVHPDLGEHLDRSVRTGVACRYAPCSATEWTVTMPVGPLL